MCYAAEEENYLEWFGNLNTRNARCEVHHCCILQLISASERAARIAVVACRGAEHTVTNRTTTIPNGTVSDIQLHAHLRL